MYKSFVLEWIKEGKKEDFYRTIDQRFLGETEFVEEVKKKAGEETRREDNILRNKTLDEIAEGVERVTGVRLNDLRGRSRRKEILEAKSLFVRLALRYTENKRKQIAKYIERVPRMIPYLERELNDEQLEIFERRLRW